MKLVIKERKKISEAEQPKFELKTYGDLKKFIKAAIEKESMGKTFGTAFDTAINLVIGAFPATSLAKTGYDFIKGVAAGKETKKTNTFLDKIHVDPQYAKMLDDRVERAFIKNFYEQLLKQPDNTVLPTDFDINKTLENFLKQQFNNRTIVGAVSKTTG